MIEPTETESKETLDAFCDAMLEIAREAATEPELLKEAPHNRPVRRLDEVRAAKQPVVKYGFDAASRSRAVSGGPSRPRRRRASEHDGAAAGRCRRRARRPRGGGRARRARTDAVRASPLARDARRRGPARRRAAGARAARRGRAASSSAPASLPAARSRRSSPGSRGAASRIRSWAGRSRSISPTSRSQAGDALLLGAALLHAWTNRTRLREPV